jgi:hypothetical protein
MNLAPDFGTCTVVLARFGGELSWRTSANGPMLKPMHGDPASHGQITAF